MFKSKDGVLEIFEGNTPSDVLYPPAGWSIVNSSPSEAEANTLFSNLYQTATSRHVMLVLGRQRRKERIQAVKNLPVTDWSYLETVSIFYERPSTCSNNGFLPISEPGWVFYKGATPDAKKTGWFSAGDYNNATNLWNVAPQVKEEVKHIYYQKFSWELQLILMSLAEPLEHKKFIYTLPLDKLEQISLFQFCHNFGLTACLYSCGPDETKELLTNYNKYLELNK